MKRLAILAVLAFLSGCSNAPIAGFLDGCFPSKPPESRPPERPRDPFLPGDRIPPPDIGPPVGVGPPVSVAPPKN